VVSTTFASATRIAAPPEIVWDVMTDHVRYAKWGSAKTVTIERPGLPSPNGLGAIRCFHAGPMKVREEVTTWEPPTLMAYRLNTKFLTKDYTSDMRLREDDGATVLEWSSTFVPMVPGTSAIVRRIYERAVSTFAAGIKAEAEAAAEPAA
jgi:uncharacterized protein YndB with AHSA1/START domain